MVEDALGDSSRIGPYRVLHTLGVGGMGEVVLAHDDRLDRLVAIKRLHDDHSATPARRERFRREARILARLNHPAIVQIHDVLQQAGHDYLIMEYIEGQTLRERRRAGALALSEVLGIAHQIALGMAAAHDLGIIHRDLKTENVLITRTGRGKLTDFGIAKLDGDDAVTEDGAIVGTFRAMSPEQALGQPIDHRSDLFSFGVLLYEVLGGESPFRAVAPFRAMQQLVAEEPRPVAELAPSIPRDLASLVHQLLAKEPVLRPRDFHEVADALRELAGEVGGLFHGADASLDGLPSRSDDHRPTEDTEAPLASDAGDDLGSASPGGATAAPDRAPGPPSRARRRRRRVAAGAGVAAVGAVAIAVALQSRSSAAPKTHVVVLAPTVSDAEAHPGAVRLAAALRDTVEDDLQGRVGVELAPRSDVDGYVDRVARSTGQPPRPSAIRAAVGADEVLAIHLACSPDRCKLTLARDPSVPGAPLAETFPLLINDAKYSRPLDLYLSNDSNNITVYLSGLYPDHPVRPRR